jgi:hypothetical protein
MVGEIAVTNLSFNSRRIVVGLALVVMLVCLADFAFDLGVFGRFSKAAFALSVAALISVLRFIGPTIDEVRAYRDRRRGL